MKHAAYWMSIVFAGMCALNVYLREWWAAVFIGLLALLMVAQSIDNP